MVAGALIPDGFCGDDNAAVLDFSVQNAAVAQQNDPLGAHGDDVLELPHAGGRADSGLAEAQPLFAVVNRINRPDAVRVVGLGNDLTLQKRGHGGKKSVGKDGDHRFREMFHRLMDKVRVDDGAGRGVKFR